MATGAFLPPVVTRLTMNIDDFVAGAAKAKAALAGLPDSYKLEANMDAALAKMEKFKNLTAEATFAQDALKRAVQDTNTSLLYQAAALDLVNKGLTGMNMRLDRAIANEVTFAAAMDLANNSMKDRQAVLGDLGLAMAANRGGGGGGGFGGWGWLGTPIPLFAGAFGTNGLIGQLPAWHIGLAGILDTTIALVSATIALTAGMAAMSASAQDIYTRFKAMQTVNGALGVNFAPFNGQWDQIQQNAAGPTIGAYGGIMGLAGNVSQYAGSIQQITDGIDSAVAKLDIYQQSQNGLNGVLQHGIGFAGQFESILGNLGKTFSNFMSAEPGTAHYFMDFIQGISAALAWVSHFNGALKALLIFHGVRTYFGSLYTLAGNLLGRLPLVGTSIKAAMGDPFIAAATVAVAYLATGWHESTKAVGDYINAQNRALQQMTAGAAANALPGNIQGTAAMAKALSPQSILNSEKGWSGFFNNLHPMLSEYFKKNIQDFSPPSQLPHAGGILQTPGNIFSDLLGRGTTGAQYSQDEVNLQQHIMSMSGSMNALYQTMGPLVKRGYSVQQAFALMTLAGVGVNDKYTVMQQKVQNLIRGYGDLGENAGMLTSSINAVNFAAEQQNSKISQVTQGWSSFLNMLTGGTTAFGSVEQQLLGMYQTSTTGATTISVANGKVSASTKATAAGVSTSIGGMSSSALQMYSTFANGISDAGNAINQLYTLDSAASLGAQGVNLVQQGSKDLVAQFLPAAKGSQLLTTLLYGLAQQGGYKAADSFSQLTKWVGNVKNPSQAYLGILTQLTGAAGNLATDVMNLANAINPQMEQAMSGALITATGLNGTLSTYAGAVWKGNTNSKTFATTAGQVVEGLLHVYGNTQTANQEFDAFSKRLGISQGAADRLFNDLIASGGKSSAAVIRDLQAIQNQLNGLQTSKTITVTTLYNTVSGGAQAPGIGVASRSVLHKQGVPGFAKGTSGAGSGWAWVGEKGPELVNFRGGETVIPNHVASGYANGAGSYEPVTHEINVYLDGKKIYRSTQKEAVSTQRRTGSNGLTKRSR